jgi:hypothetical protein
MQRIRKHVPSPGLVVAIVALVVALGGTSYAAFGLGKLTTKAKDKTVGVGKLTYVTGGEVSGPGVKDAIATCPSGLRPIGGGSTRTGTVDLHASHPTPAGWKAVANLVAPTDKFRAVVACARSRVVTNAPPA